MHASCDLHFGQVLTVTFVLPAQQVDSGASQQVCREVLCLCRLQQQLDCMAWEMCQHILVVVYIGGVSSEETLM
jgi:hypothetical protein